jgi:hypothetical protein
VRPSQPKQLADALRAVWSSRPKRRSAVVRANELVAPRSSGGLPHCPGICDRHFGLRPPLRVWSTLASSSGADGRMGDRCARCSHTHGIGTPCRASIRLGRGGSACSSSTAIRRREPEPIAALLVMESEPTQTAGIRRVSAAVYRAELIVNGAIGKY